MASTGQWMTARGAANRAADEPAEDQPGRLFLVAAYAVLFALGVALALFGVFLLPAGPHIGSTVVLPIGLVIALLGHPLAAVHGVRLAGTRLGAAAPFFGWAVVVLLSASGTAEGDVILSGSSRSLVYLLVGAGAYLAVVAMARPTRGPAFTAGRTAYARPGTAPPRR